MKKNIIQGTWFLIIAFGILGLTFGSLGVFFLHEELTGRWEHLGKLLHDISIIYLVFGVDLLLNSISLASYVLIRKSWTVSCLKTICLLSSGAIIISAIWFFDVVETRSLPFVFGVLFFAWFSWVVSKRLEEE